MYRNATCIVKWKGELGEEIGSDFGVLQGGMSSPFLFTEFLTDLKDFLHSKYGTLLGDKLLTYLLFADDMIICADSAQALQSLLDGLFEFCKKWHLIVSLTKTKIIVFNKKIVDDKFYYNNQEVEIVKQYKYLGAIFSSDTSNHFTHNYQYLSDQAQKGLFALSHYVVKNVRTLTPCLYMKMFDVHINPILMYGSEVWYKGSRIDSMEKLYLGFLKYTFKVKRSTCTSAIYSETGTFPLFLKQKYQVIKYWQRILSLPCDHILRRAYEDLLDIMFPGDSNNWCTHVKQRTRPYKHQNQPP